MPDTCSNDGEMIAPAARITSLSHAILFRGESNDVANCFVSSKS